VEQTSIPAEKENASSDSREIITTGSPILQPETFQETDIQENPLEKVDGMEIPCGEITDSGFTSDQMQYGVTKGDQIDHIMSLLEMLRDGIQSLQTGFDSKIKYDSSTNNSRCCNLSSQQGT